MEETYLRHGMGPMPDDEMKRWGESASESIFTVTAAKRQGWRECLLLSGGFINPTAEEEGAAMKCCMVGDGHLTRVCLLHMIGEYNKSAEHCHLKPIQLIEEKTDGE